jgi:hypothetical protein
LVGWLCSRCIRRLRLDRRLECCPSNDKGKCEYNRHCRECHITHWWTRFEKRKERRIQGFSRDPDQGAQRRSVGQCPISGAAKHCFFAPRAEKAQIDRSSGSRNLTLSRHSNCAAAVVRPRSCALFVLRIDCLAADTLPAPRSSLRLQNPGIQKAGNGCFRVMLQGRRRGAWPHCLATCGKKGGRASIAANNWTLAR